MNKYLKNNDIVSEKVLILHAFLTLNSPMDCLGNKAPLHINGSV